MSRREVRVERLLRKVVHDVNGERVGRIEEIRAARHASECMVTEYHIGAFAVAERLSVLGFMHAILRALPRHGGYQGYRVSWEEMDIRDPDHPRTVVAKEELKRRPA